MKITVNEKPYDEGCIHCKSSNIKMIRKGSETDMFQCNDCKEKFLITYPERW